MVKKTDYNPERLRTIESLENEHFWFAPRRRRLLKIISRHVPLGSKILDIGCGTGRLCNALIQDGYAAYGTDPYIVASGLDPRRYREGTCDQLPFETGSFDAACAFDVFEHVDDIAALQECRRVLRPGGLLLVSVPAFPVLWSERDTVAGHKRRYTRPMLKSLFANGGFELLDLSGFQFFLLPLMFLNRLGESRKNNCVRREDHVSPRTNRLLRQINNWEVSLPHCLQPPVGSSLIAVCRAASDTSTAI